MATRTIFFRRPGALDENNSFCVLPDLWYKKWFSLEFLNLFNKCNSYNSPWILSLEDSDIFDATSGPTGYGITGIENFMKLARTIRYLDATIPKTGIFSKDRIIGSYVNEYWNSIIKTRIKTNYAYIEFSNDFVDKKVHTSMTYDYDAKKLLLSNVSDNISFNINIKNSFNTPAIGQPSFNLTRALEAELGSTLTLSTADQFALADKYYQPWDLNYKESPTNTFEHNFDILFETPRFFAGPIVLNKPDGTTAAMVVEEWYVSYTFSPVYPAAFRYRINSYNPYNIRSFSVDYLLSELHSRTYNTHRNNDRPSRQEENYFSNEVAALNNGEVCANGRALHALRSYLILKGAAIYPKKAILIDDSGISATDNYTFTVDREQFHLGGGSGKTDLNTEDMKYYRSTSDLIDGDPNRPSWSIPQERRGEVTPYPLSIIAYFSPQGDLPPEPPPQPDEPPVPEPPAQPDTPPVPDQPPQPDEPQILPQGPVFTLTYPVTLNMEWNSISTLDSFISENLPLGHSSSNVVAIWFEKWVPNSVDTTITDTTIGDKRFGDVTYYLYATIHPDRSEIHLNLPEPLRNLHSVYPASDVPIFDPYNHLPPYSPSLDDTEYLERRLEEPPVFQFHIPPQLPPCNPRKLNDPCFTLFDYSSGKPTYIRILWIVSKSDRVTNYTYNGTNYNNRSYPNILASNWGNYQFDAEDAQNIGIKPSAPLFASASLASHIFPSSDSVDLRCAHFYDGIYSEIPSIIDKIDAYNVKIESDSTDVGTGEVIILKEEFLTFQTEIEYEAVEKGFYNTIRINGLLDNTTYKISVAAYNSLGTSPSDFTTLNITTKNKDFSSYRVYVDRDEQSGFDIFRLVALDVESTLHAEKLEIEYSRADNIEWKPLDNVNYINNNNLLINFDKEIFFQTYVIPFFSSGQWLVRVNSINGTSKKIGDSVNFYVSEIISVPNEPIFPAIEFEKISYSRTAFPGVDFFIDKTQDVLQLRSNIFCVLRAPDDFDDDGNLLDPRRILTVLKQDPDTKIYDLIEETTLSDEFNNCQLFNNSIVLSDINIYTIQLTDTANNIREIQIKLQDNDNNADIIPNETIVDPSPRIDTNFNQGVIRFKPDNGGYIGKDYYKSLNSTELTIRDNNNFEPPLLSTSETFQPWQQWRNTGFFEDIIVGDVVFWDDGVFLLEDDDGIPFNDVPADPPKIISVNKITGTEAQGFSLIKINLQTQNLNRNTFRSYLIQQYKNNNWIDIRPDRINIDPNDTNNLTEISLKVLTTDAEAKYRVAVVVLNYAEQRRLSKFKEFSTLFNNIVLEDFN